MHVLAAIASIKVNISEGVSGTPGSLLKYDPEQHRLIKHFTAGIIMLASTHMYNYYKCSVEAKSVHCLP